MVIRAELAEGVKRGVAFSPVRPKLLERTSPTRLFRRLREAACMSGSTGDERAAPFSSSSVAVAYDALRGVFVAKHRKLTGDCELLRGDGTFRHSGFHAVTGIEGARKASIGDDFVLRKASPIRCARMISVC